MFRRSPENEPFLGDSSPETSDEKHMIDLRRRTQRNRRGYIAAVIISALLSMVATFVGTEQFFTYKYGRGLRSDLPQLNIPNRK